MLDERNTHGVEAVTSSWRGMPGGVENYFGTGHLVVRSGGAVYVALCRMVVAELRNHTKCTLEIPVTYQGRNAYVEPLSLVVQRSATPVKCRRKNPTSVEDREGTDLRIP